MDLDKTKRSLTCIKYINQQTHLLCLTPDDDLRTFQSSLFTYDFLIEHKPLLDDDILFP